MKLPALSAGVLLALGQGYAAEALALRAPPGLSVEIVVNPVAGSARSGCQAWSAQAPARKEWWVGIAQAKPDAEEGWSGTSGQVRCGNDVPGSSQTEPDGSPGAPYVVASGSTLATTLRQVEDETILVVEVSLMVRKLSAFGPAGEPIYQPSELRRRVHFTESRDAFLPLFIANDAEKAAFGVHEVFMKVSGEMETEGVTETAYGAVSIAADVMQAEILLDGGVAGRVEGGTATLRNVPRGWHEVGLRDVSGREARKPVHVRGKRTVLVELKLPDPPAGAVVPYRLTPLGSNGQGYDEYRRAADGAVAVKVPAGEFLMGNKDAERSPLEHRVYVSDFLMDKTAVTWHQYKKFAAATGMPLPPQEPYWGIHDDHPAVFVTWEEARAYCEWVGGRLPTEAEREKAARGTDGRRYPWGDEEPDTERAVFRRTWGHKATAAVGIHPGGASPYGLLDMAGNVWEWCSDWYDEGYYSVSPARDPTGPRSGTAHVVRGGSWDSRPTVLNTSVRSWGHRGYREGDFGFRCAMNAPK